MTTPRYLPNKEVERLALRAVRLHEKRRRKLKSIRNICRAPRRSGYDLISGDHRIEVKGTQGQQHFQKLVVSSLAEVRNLRKGRLAVPSHRHRLTPRSCSPLSREAVDVSRREALACWPEAELG